MALLFLFRLACLLVTTSAFLQPPSPFPASNPALLVYPTPLSLPATVHRISHTNRSIDAQLTLFTLQGCLARSALNTTTPTFPLLYKTTATANTSTDGTWTYWQYYQDKYGFGRVQFSEQYADSSVDDIVGQFSGYVSGYYLSHYTQQSEADNVNMAISMASITDRAIVTTAAYVPLMKRLNIPLLRDMRDYTESTFLSQFQPLNTSVDAPQWPFNRQYISAQTPTKAATFLTDWSMLASAVKLHHIPTAQAVLTLVPDGRMFAWLGWTADTWGENDMTSIVSAAGGIVWAADTQNNLGTHAFFRDPLPPLPKPALVNNKGKHTVAFLFTDGDSLVADTGAVVDRRHWTDARRGTYPLSFGVDPSLALLAPSTLGLMYDTAGQNDSIVAFAPGYAYPSYMSDEQVWMWAEAASATMAAAQLRMQYYIDFNYSSRYFAPLLHQSNIDAVVYFDYPNYYILDHGRNGSVTWVDHKPAIALRDSMWTGHSTPQSIAAVLNSQLRDHTQTAGYSVIAAHLWTQDVGTIGEVVAQLDGDGVVVVRLEELVALMSANVQEADRVTAEVPTRPSQQTAQQRARLATE